MDVEGAALDEEEEGMPRLWASLSFGLTGDEAEEVEEAGKDEEEAEELLERWAALKLRLRASNPFRPTRDSESAPSTEVDADGTDVAERPEVDATPDEEVVTPDEEEVPVFVAAALTESEATTSDKESFFLLLPDVEALLPVESGEESEDFVKDDAVKDDDDDVMREEEIGVDVEMESGAVTESCLDSAPSKLDFETILPRVAVAMVIGGLTVAVVAAVVEAVVSVAEASFRFLLALSAAATAPVIEFPFLVRLLCPSSEDPMAFVV